MSKTEFASKDLKDRVEDLESSKILNPESSWLNNVNLNDFTVTGFYLIGQGVTNSPGSNYEWGVLIVIAPRTDTIRQIFLAGENLCLRQKQNGTWSQWQKMI